MIRELHVKPTLHRMATLETRQDKALKMMNAGEDVEKVGTYLLLMRMKNGAAITESRMVVPPKIKMGLISRDVTIPILGFHPK